MVWLRDNWFWLVFGVLFLWVHLRMHGSHGAHHGRREPCGTSDSPSNAEDHPHAQH